MHMYILLAVDQMLTEVERESSLPVARLYFLHRRQSLQLNCFLMMAVRGILEGKNYCPVDVIFTIVFTVFNSVTGCTEFPKVSRVHSMCCVFLSRDLYCNCEQGWTREEVKAISAEMCEFKTEAFELSSSVCTSGSYTTKFSLLDYSVEGFRKIGDL